MEVPWMQPTKRRPAIVIHLLVRKRAGSKGHWRASASFMWSNMRQRAEIPQKKPTPMRPNLSCRTVPSMLADGSRSKLLLREIIDGKEMYRNRLRGGLELRPAV